MCDREELEEKREREFSTSLLIPQPRVIDAEMAREWLRGYIPDLLNALIEGFNSGDDKTRAAFYILGLDLVQLIEACGEVLHRSKNGSDPVLRIRQVYRPEDPDFDDGNLRLSRILAQGFQLEDIVPGEGFAELSRMLTARLSEEGM